MGSACSYGEDARHHRENRKNRINPTETYDKWQQKMLLDIGADPLAVIRDFPRMTVFVHTMTCCNFVPDCYSPISDSEAAASSEKPHQQEQTRRKSPFNPLAPRSRSQTHYCVDTDAAGAADTEGESKQQQRRRRRMEKASGPALRVDASAGACANADAGGSWSSPTASPLLAPHPPPNVMARGGAGAQRSGLQEPSCDDDAFAARMQRVREAVLLLSELCNERATFGASFESAWDRLVVHGSVGGRANNLDSNAAGESAPGATQDGRPPPSSKKFRNQPITLDVHQVLLNACLDSGMLMLLDDANSAAALAPPPHGAAQERIIGSVLAPLSLQSGAPTGLVNRPSPPDTSSASGLQLHRARTATGLTAGGATGSKCGTVNSDSQQQRNRESAAASTSSVPASMARAARISPQTTAALIATPSRYVVRSATFHLMQFATQGVMFFPVQRLKHVLWMPWSSHMQDRAWTIHFHVKDATPEDLIARRQHHLRTLFNTSTSALLPSADSAAVLAVAGADGHRDSLSTALPSTAVTTDADGWKLPAISGADASAGGWNNTCGAGVNEGVHKCKIIVIHHFQTGRHYVEDSERKTTPVYELDWACSIRVDQDTLLKAFSPYQGYAVAAKDAAAASPSVPLLPSRNPSLLQEMTMEAASLVSHPRQHLCDDDDHETVTVDASPSVTTSDNVSETAFPRRPVVVPDATLHPELIALDVGVLTTQQPQLLQREVLRASVEVVAARMAKPPLTFCMVSSTWRKRKEELDYMLKQQYNVQLMQVNELPKKLPY
ncbi:conserved hypothetical protein [Leishmania infantum JPCM5]|uniref:Uncharacterized protein n=2 Tax=Leishmania infantum TaxID=5671 RepID=A4I278_LEIIN|nr:conserved hypothetical protein [Leishmania infantum JPCM5]CAC9496839.1 hypothetical_protein_-_conserved [Leishmania infantum]CAM68865.1 conserved hypothetical protein [Leishmania infantum JPCM5]SUZ42734.1 hypothetical_protein_-_conserved [Leishmania infantum]|eukprot:XP_001470489.1 conserved hypothetical protein [Leishmania infantum JPCM5]